MNIEKLKKDYDQACMNYIKAFEEKHEVYFEFWVAGRVGEIASFGDTFFFNLNEIKYDIDNEIETGKIFFWNDYCIQRHFENKPQVNFRNYCKGIL